MLVSSIFIFIYIWIRCYMIVIDLCFVLCATWSQWVCRLIGWAILSTQAMIYPILYRGNISVQSLDFKCWFDMFHWDVRDSLTIEGSHPTSLRSWTVLEFHHSWSLVHNWHFLIIFGFDHFFDFTFLSRFILTTATGAVNCIKHKADWKLICHAYIYFASCIFVIHLWYNHQRASNG